MSHDSRTGGGKGSMLLNLRIHAKDIKFWTTVSGATPCAELKRDIERTCLDNGLAFHCSQLIDGEGYVLPDHLTVGAVLKDADTVTAATKVKAEGDPSAAGVLQTLLGQFEACASAAQIFVANEAAVRDYDPRAGGGHGVDGPTVPIAGLVMVSCFLHSPDKSLVRAALLALEKFVRSSAFCRQFAHESDALPELCRMARDPDTPADAVEAAARILSRIQEAGDLQLGSEDANNVMQTFVCLASGDPGRAMLPAGLGGAVLGGGGDAGPPPRSAGDPPASAVGAFGRSGPAPLHARGPSGEYGDGGDGGPPAGPGMVRDTSLTALAREHAKAQALADGGSIQFDFAQLAALQGRGSASMDQQVSWLVALLRSRQHTVKWFAVAGLEQVPDIGVVVRALENADSGNGVLDLLDASHDEWGSEFHEAAEGAGGRGSRIGFALLKGDGDGDGGGDGKRAGDGRPMPAGDYEGDHGHEAGRGRDPYAYDDHGYGYGGYGGAADGGGFRGDARSERGSVTSSAARRGRKGRGVSAPAAAAQLAAAELVSRIVRTPKGMEMVDAVGDEVVTWLVDRFTHGMPGPPRDAAERALVSIFGDEAASHASLKPLFKLASMPAATAMKAAARALAAFASRDEDNLLGDSRRMLSLMELASSDNIDIGLPAALALAQVGLKERNKGALLAEGGATLFAELLASGADGKTEDGDVRLQRVAAKALANLAASNETTQAKVVARVEELAYRWRDIDDSIVMMYMKMFMAS